MVRFDRTTIIKFFILVLFIIGAIAAFNNPTLQSYLTKESIETFVASFGIFGPIIYMLVYAVAMLFILPGTPFTAVGAILFGPWLGTMYTIIGATLGAAGAFWMARTLGHDFAQNLFGEKIKAYDEKLAKHGFATIFYLRMVFFPFNILNFGAGLTQVKFRDFLFGTFLGIIPGTFIITFFVATVADVFFAHGFFSREFLISLVSIRVLTAIGLFGLSFFIPSCIRNVAKKCGKDWG